MSSGRTYEMLWDCPYCGTDKLLGKTHRFCPNCGASQDPATRYFPSDEEKVAVEDHVLVGADVTCPACSALNVGTAEFCGSCGSPLTEAAKVSRLADESRAAGESFASSGSRDAIKEKFDAEMLRVGVTKAKNKSGVNKKLIAILVAVALVIVGVVAALTITRETTVVVDGHSWEREIQIQEYRNFTESNWRDVRPSGDNVVRGSCVQQQRGSRQVPDGQECRTVRSDNGDGTFSEREECTTKYRSEPIYDDWCTYTGQRWEYDRSATTNGDSVDKTPYWEAVTLNCEGQRRIGCEQISARNEQYLVHFTGDGNRYECPFPQAEWTGIPNESIWSVKVRVVDASAADCGSLTRQN